MPVVYLDIILGQPGMLVEEAYAYKMFEFECCIQLVEGWWGILMNGFVVIDARKFIVDPRGEELRGKHFATRSGLAIKPWDIEGNDGKYSRDRCVRGIKRIEKSEEKYHG